MLFEFSLQTEKENLYDITDYVREAINKSNIAEGVCLIYCPHTTAGITINENADPDVAKDILYGLNKAFPDYKEFRHLEGNSAAHLKASCIGASESIIITNKQPILGTWQGIYFCEFDGPRTRKFYIKVT